MHKTGWQLLLEAAEQLTASGVRYFGRQDLIRSVHRLDPSWKESTLNPMIQGMTINARGGVPARCGYVFRRVDRGVYELIDESERSKVSSSVQASAARTRRPRIDIQERIHGLTAGFESYIEIYDRRFPFTKTGQYQLHRQTIERRREHRTVENALRDDLFIDLLYRTLRKWGIGVRGSRLALQEDFRDALLRHLDELRRLQTMSIGVTSPDVAQQVYQLIANLGVVENKAKLVAGSKTLHHLLPDLVPPMDRRYTGAFFGWSTLAPQDSQQRIFLEAFSAFERIAATVEPTRFVGRGWRTSPSKILDNAIVGYCISQDL